MFFIARGKGVRFIKRATTRYRSSFDVAVPKQNNTRYTCHDTAVLYVLYCTYQQTALALLLQMIERTPTSASERDTARHGTDLWRQVHQQ